MGSQTAGHAICMHYLIAAAKTSIVFLVLWAISRSLHKHLVGEITLFDYLSTITLGTLAGSVLSNNQQTAVVLATAAFWAGLTLLFDRFNLAGRRIRSILIGDPVVLVENGRVLEENLRKVRVSLHQLESLLRIKGYFDIAEVEVCLLETNGKVSVRPRSQNRPVHPSDLGLSTRYEALSSLVMQEGRPLTQQLQRLGLSEAWLSNQLSKQGIHQPEEVFAAWLTSDGRLVVDLHRDQIH